MILDDEYPALLDPEDALEAKLRLGVLASTILEGAHIFCTDTGLLSLDTAGKCLQKYAADFEVLASAMEVLERRGRSPVSPTSPARTR